MFSEQNNPNYLSEECVWWVLRQSLSLFLVLWAQHTALDTHCPGVEAEADEQEDLGDQDGKGKIGMDVVALVPDCTHRPVNT